GKQLEAFADVDVVSSGSQLKKVDTDEFIALLDGRTLPISVRIEQGVSFCSDPNCQSDVVGLTPPDGQYTKVVSGDGQDVGVFPANWFDPNVAGTDQVIVTIADATADLAKQPGGCSVGVTTMLSKPGCVRFTTQPKVTFTNTVIVGTCIDNPGDERQLPFKWD